MSLFACIVSLDGTCYRLRCYWTCLLIIVDWFSSLFYHSLDVFLYRFPIIIPLLACGLAAPESRLVLFRTDA
jgi:hypothetical protein